MLVAAKAHARFSPSSAERVTSCPASLRLSDGLPDSVSWEAVEGTIAHAIHEYGLARGFAIDKFEEMEPQAFMPRAEMHEAEWAVVPANWRVPREMIDYVQKSMDYCREYVGETFVETRVNISRYTPVPDQFGTCDFAVIYWDAEAREYVLRIIDLKYGMGVKVDAFQNKQLALYALGFMEEYDFAYSFNRVEICVSQPRLDHFDEWKTTADELRVLGAYIKQRFTLALEENAPFGPSEKACKFCKAKATCPALYRRAFEASQGWFDDLAQPAEQPSVDGTWPLSTPDTRRMNLEHIRLVLDNAKLIRGFIDEVEAHALHLALHGTTVPGYKVVEGRSVRTISNVSGYETHLRENGVEPFKPAELIGVSEAEKALKGAAKKGLSAFLTKPKGKPTLAPESDKREPYTLTADQMFNEEEL
jgi:hypothetical protein